MDISNMILTENIGRPDTLPDLRGIDKASEQEKEHLAKEFESLIVNRLLDEMNASVGSLGLEEDGAAKQIKGIFNFFMAQHIGANGGFGLWKDIYNSLNQMNQNPADRPKELDEQI